MKLSLIASLLFLPALCQAEQLIRITAEDVVDRLRRDGVLVCFERVHNQKEDAITLKAQLEAIQHIPQGQRTERENGLLESLVRSKKEGLADEVIVNWKQKKFDFIYPDSADTPEQILDALVKSDSDYVWEQRDRRYLLYPKEGSFNCSLLGFTAKELQFLDFVKAAQDQIFTPSRINHIFAGVGRPWTLNYQDKIFSLTLGPSDSRTALTAFCDAIGPNIVWHVIGCDPNWVNVSFAPVKPKN